MIKLQIVIALVLNALALMATTYVVPGFSVDNFTTAVLAAIVLGVVNTFIRPVLAFLTAPLTVVTLGLFTFVVNAVMLFIVSAVVPGVMIAGWVPAILASIVLAVVSTVLNSVLIDLQKVRLGK
ncbi:phage holin family protein [Candidatus Daviesbacteria bacterium]|nr:phage holin family protein [Candidatus Daviesbacteria bacterium]